MTDALLIVITFLVGLLWGLLGSADEIKALKARIALMDDTKESITRTKENE